MQLNLLVHVFCLSFYVPSFSFLVCFVVSLSLYFFALSLVP